jgi:DNA-binding MarR family transcriptional regulator
VTLNVRSGGGAQTGAPDRRQTSADLLNELASFNPRQLMSAFRHWHQGALSLIHLNVLTVLEAAGPMSMTRLAEELDVSVASATGIVSRMKDRGLVDRRHDERDRRVVLVHQTETGANVFTDLDEHRREHLAQCIERLNEKEQASLLVGLRAMRAARSAIKAEAEEDVGEGTAR